MGNCFSFSSSIQKWFVLKVIRHILQGGAVGSPDPLPPGELYYVLGILGPVACRDPSMFVELARKCMRIKVPPARKSKRYYLKI